MGFLRTCISLSANLRASLTNATNSNIKVEVNGGIVTLGPLSHETNRACASGNKRRKDELRNKKECSLCGIIGDSHDMGKTGWFITVRP